MTRPALSIVGPGLTATLYAVGAAYLLTTLTPLLGGAWKRMGPPANGDEPAPRD